MVDLDGELISIGGTALDSPGYDLLALLMGSEGMLGIVLFLQPFQYPVQPGVHFIDRQRTVWRSEAQPEGDTAGPSRQFIASVDVERLQGLGLSPEAAIAQIDTLVTSQAYLIATNWVLWVAALLMLSMLPLIWFAKPPFVARAGVWGERCLARAVVHARACADGARARGGGGDEEVGIGGWPVAGVEERRESRGRRRR